MLGLADPWVFIALLLCLLSVVLCLIWGAVYWNRDIPDTEPDEEIRHWIEEEERVEEEL